MCKCYEDSDNSMFSIQKRNIIQISSLSASNSTRQISFKCNISKIKYLLDV